MRLPRAGNPAPEIFLWSRLAIWAAALFSFFVFVPNRHPRAAVWDDPKLTHDLGAITDVWARWDSVWFLRIAEHGYGSAKGAAAAFYPLYPAAVALLGRVLFGHYVLAGILVSLAASFASFLLLYRIAEERLGADGARRAVLYLAVFPFALFLQAVYSESLYLLLTLAAFMLAERRRFLAAGAVTGLALLTRPTAAALLPALALLAWHERDRVRALASLAVAPLLFAAYPLYLWIAEGDPWQFLHAQRLWSRHLSPAGPLGGIWDGLRAGWAGVEQLASGSHTHVYWTPVQDSDPIRVAVLNLEALAFLVLFVVLAVIAWRRFGAPYGLFAALSLAIPLSVPSERWPLLSLPRFGLTIFPLFLALAVLGGRPRAHTGDRGRQLDPARGLGRAMGALAVGRMRIALVSGRGAAAARRDRLRRALRADRRARAASYPVNVQGAGDKPTVVSAVPRRIVPGRRRAEARSCTSLGLGKRTVAVDDTLVGLPLVDAIRRAKPDLIVASSETDPLDIARARSATHCRRLRRARQLGRERRPGDRRPRPAHRPRRPGPAADGPDRGEAPGRRPAQSPARRS